MFVLVLETSNLVHRLIIPSPSAVVAKHPQKWRGRGPPKRTRSRVLGRDDVGLQQNALVD